MGEEGWLTVYLFLLGFCSSAVPLFPTWVSWPDPARLLSSPLTGKAAGEGEPSWPAGRRPLRSSLARPGSLPWTEHPWPAPVRRGRLGSPEVVPGPRGGGLWPSRRLVSLFPPVVPGRNRSRSPASWSCGHLWVQGRGGPRGGPEWRAEGREWGGRGEASEQRFGNLERRLLARRLA